MIERNKRFSVKTILVAAVSVLLLIAMSIGLVLALPSQSVNQKAEAATDFTTPTAAEQKEIDNNILADWGNPISSNLVQLTNNTQMSFSGDKWYYLTSDINLNDTRTNLYANCNVRILLNGYRITGSLRICIGANARVSFFDKIPNKSGTGYNYNPNSNGSILMGAFTLGMYYRDTAVLNIYGINILNSTHVEGAGQYSGILISGLNAASSAPGGTINAYQMTIKNCATRAVNMCTQVALNFKYCNIYDNSNDNDIYLMDSDVICKFYKCNIGKIYGVSNNGTGGLGTRLIYTKDVNFGNRTVTITPDTLGTFFQSISGISGTIELLLSCTTTYIGNSPNLNFIVSGNYVRVDEVNQLTLSRSARANTVVVSGTGQIDSGATVNHVLHDGINGRLIDNRQNPAIAKGSAGSSRSKVTVNSGANLNVLDIQAGDYVGIGAITNPPTTDIGTSSGITVSLSGTSFVYNGQPHTPAVTVRNNGTTLTQGIDYTVAYSNNINPGTATVTVTGMGYYTGTKTATFTITGVDIGTNNITISVAGGPFVYNGQEHRPAVTVKNNGTTLTHNTDYTVSYANNINASITTRASVTITGKGNYTGSKTVEFTIDRANRPAFNLTELNVDQPGKTLQDFNDRLPSGWSWQNPELAIDSNVTSVVAEYTAADKANYINTTETVLVRYNGILPNSPEKNIALATIMLENNQTSFTYTGNEFRPKVTVTARDGVTLVEGRDYTVSYMHNKDAGIANILVEAIPTTRATNNSYYGKQMVNFEIKRAAVKEAPISSITITNAGTLLGQCQLPIGWTWENPSLEITANTGVVYAVYTGSDSGNYFNTRARISVVYNVANAGVITGGNVSSNGAMIVWIVVGVLLFVILIIILLLVLGKRRNKEEEAEEFTKLVALGNVYQARMQQQAMIQQQMLNMARPRQVVRRVVRRPIEDRSFMLGDGRVNRASDRDSQQFYLPSGRDNSK